MYIYDLYSRYRNGENLDEKDQKLLLDAFKLKESMIKKERAENSRRNKRTALTLGAILATVTTFGVFGDNIGSYISKNIKELNSRMEQYQKSPRGQLNREIYAWAEKDRILENNMAFGYIDPKQYIEKHNALEVERKELKKRMEELK